MFYRTLVTENNIDLVGISEDVDADKILDTVHGEQVYKKILKAFSRLINGTNYNDLPPENIKRAIRQCDKILDDIKEEKASFNSNSVSGRMKFAGSFLKRLILRDFQALAAALVLSIAGPLGMGAWYLSVGLPTYVLDWVNFGQMIWTIASYRSVLNYYEREVKNIRDDLQRELKEYGSSRRDRRY